MPNAKLMAAVLCGLASLAGGALHAAPETKPAGQIVSPPAFDAVRARVLDWVAQRGVTEKAKLEEIAKPWAPTDDPRSAEDLFRMTIRTFCEVDPETKAFVAACGLERAPLLAPEAKAVERADYGKFYQANVGLFYVQYLAHRQMFEECLEASEKIAIADVVDPAALLFYRAVCQHHLLMKIEGLATIEQLVKNTENVPVRYATVATLMQYDLEALKDKSLDEISRKMTDVERRLTLGRAGEKVQKKEEEIIVTLDEIIKKIEEQQGGGGGGGGAGGQNNRSSSPANDSVIKGSTAPGKVDPKKLGKQGDWGDLPPKARAKAKDLIAREFPAHYRAAIEEFTRKAASRSANSGK